jgi:hypothetical protein
MHQEIAGAVVVEIADATHADVRASLGDSGAGYNCVVLYGEHLERSQFLALHSCSTRTRPPLITSTCISTVGRDTEVIRDYIRKQEEEDMRLEQMNLWR